MSEQPESAPPKDLTALHQGYDTFSADLSVGSRFMRALRKGLRRVLSPILLRQVDYNAASARLGSHLWEETERLRQRQEDLVAEQSRLLASVNADFAAHIEQLLEQQERALLQVRETLAAQAELLGDRQDEAILKLRAGVAEHAQSNAIRLEELETLLSGLRAGARSLDPSHALDHTLDSLHAALLDRFRGPRDVILERLRVYLPILEAAGVPREGLPALDLGCGRGEWLELLRGEGVSAHGVDLNRTFLDVCRSRALSVEEVDAFVKLRSLPPACLGVVTAFHLIEHLAFAELVRLFDECRRVLAPGGLVILEAPNPGNLIVASQTFWNDPTHRNPLPSDLVRFLAGERGLEDCSVFELHPYPESSRVAADGSAAAERLNQLCYGARDYALIAFKRQ